MRMTLKSKNVTPYGGQFQLNDPAHGIVGFGTDFNMLYTNCRLWRKANGWGIGLHFEDELEQAVCAKYPAACTHAFDDGLPVRRGRLQDTIVARGTKVMIAHWLNHAQVVTQDEANARAAVCAKCPWKTEINYSCGGPCGEIVGIISMTADKSTTPDVGNTSCGICGCFLRTAVWLPLSVQCNGLTSDMIAEFNQIRASDYPCWKKC